MLPWERFASQILYATQIKLHYFPTAPNTPTGNKNRPHETSSGTSLSNWGFGRSFKKFWASKNP